MHIKVMPATTPPGKVADVELHFADGPLAGLKLIGFAVWERRGGSGLNVTFPARQYSINGERRSFALLRPTDDATATDRLRDAIVAAYLATQEPPEPTTPTEPPLYADLAYSSREERLQADRDEAQARNGVRR